MWASAYDRWQEPFTPPIRVFPGYLLAFQYRNRIPGGIFALMVSILYRETPV
jgi:hypothetical protein